MDKLLDKIIEEMKKDNALTDNKENEEIVRVGLEILITKVFFAIAILIVGLLMKCFFESIVFAISFSMLREYGGGYHAESRTKCLVLSFITLVVALGIIVLNKIFHVLMLPTFILSIISVIYILYKAPIDTLNKRLDKDEIRVYGNKARILTIIMFLVAVLLLYIRYNNLAFAVLTGIIMEAYLMIKGQIQNFRYGDEQ